MKTARLYIKFSFFAAMMLISCLANTAAAQVQLSDYDLHLKSDDIPISYFPQPDGEFELEEIIDFYGNSAFSDPEPYPVLGYTNKTVWFAIEIDQTAIRDAAWVLEIKPSNLERVQMFLVPLEENTLPARSELNYLEVSSSQGISTPAQAFSFTLKNGKHLILLSVSGNRLLNILPQIYAEAAASRILSERFVTIGIAYGLIIAIAMICIFSGVFLESHSQIIFGVYLTLNSFFWLSHEGFLGYFFFDGEQQLVNLMHYTLITMTYLLSNYVFYKILTVERYSAWFRLVLFAMSAISLVLFITDLLNSAQKLLPVIISNMFVVIGCLSYISVRNIASKTETKTKIYSAVYLVYSSSFCVGLLYSFGLIGNLHFTHIFASSSQLIIIFGFVCVSFYEAYYDRVARTQRELKLNKLQSELAAVYLSDEEKQHFFEMIDHELRTPLNAILSSVGAMRIADEKQLESNFDYESRYQKITRNIQRIEDVSKLVSSQSTILDKSAKSVRLNIVDEIEDIIFRMPDSHRIQFDVSGLRDNQHVFFDYYLLRFIFVNVIENALKYSPSGSPISVLVCDNDDGSDCICVFVTNSTLTNIEKNLPRFFEKYTRFDETANTAGLGIALYLIRRILQIHSGSIAVRSNAPNSCTIELRISRQLV